MNSTARKEKFIQAIKNQDSNYIKNIYVYHKPSYMKLCKDEEVKLAFSSMINHSETFFNESLLDFWKTIYYINNDASHSSGEQDTQINLDRLPDYFIKIIIKTKGTMDNNLYNHTPLWRTKNNLCVFGITGICFGLAVNSLHKVAIYFDAKNLIANVATLTIQKIHEVYADHSTRNVACHMFLSCMCLGVILHIGRQHSTREAVINFFDWIKYKHVDAIQNENNEERTIDIN